MTKRAGHGARAPRGRPKARRRPLPGPDEPESPASRILAAADRLFYGEGIHAVGVDAVAAGAGVTKRTLYHHFASKDALVTAYLSRRAAPPVIDQTMPPAAQILRLFRQLGKALTSETFRGCPFINAAAELADRNHQAITVASAYKARREAWFRNLTELAGARDPAALAQQLMILLDGAIANWLVRRDPSTADAAGAAAAMLLRGAGVALPADDA